MQSTVSKPQDFYDTHYMVFRRKVKQLNGLDLDDYRSEQMTRRLGVIMTRSGARNLTEYARMLETDPKRLKEFTDYLTINVSEFFRDLDRFTFLRQSVLPGLLAQNKRLNIWSSGCSNGAEPYSLAMLLEELAPRQPHKILASDVDERILNFARAGNEYREPDVRNVPPDLRKRYLTQREDRYAVSETIKRFITFKKHNMLADPFETGFDLILCRNVVIYFTSDAKSKLFKRFVESLRPGGILFIGATEIIQGAGQLGLEGIRPSFYRRIG